MFDSILILVDAGVENAWMEELDSRSLASLLIIQNTQCDLFEKKSIDGLEGSIQEYPTPINEILDT